MLQVLQQSLAGLTYLHGENIVHRDVKPSNILVASRNPLKIKIADFGLSKHGSRLLTQCGTSDFMAPEIWTVGVAKGTDEPKGYTASVDMWALGTLFFELLFGWSFADPCSGRGKHDDTIVNRLNCYLERHCGTIAEFVSRFLLQPEDKDRETAARCHALAMDLPPPNDRIQNRRSRHFAPLYSRTDHGDNLDAMPAFCENHLLAAVGQQGNDSAYNSPSSTFPRSGAGHASQAMIPLGPRTNDSGLGDSVSTFARSCTGHGGQSMAYLSAQILYSGHTVAVPTAHRVAHGYLPSWSDVYTLEWPQGNMPRQIRKQTADDAESLVFDSQSRKRRHPSGETPENWESAVSWSEDDMVMKDDSPDN